MPPQVNFIRSYEIDHYDQKGVEWREIGKLETEYEQNVFSLLTFRSGADGFQTTLFSEAILPCTTLSVPVSGRDGS